MTADYVKYIAVRHFLGWGFALSALFRGCVLLGWLAASSAHYRHVAWVGCCQICPMPRKGLLSIVLIGAIVQIFAAAAWGAVALRCVWVELQRPPICQRLPIVSHILNALKYIGVRGSYRHLALWVLKI